MELSLLHNFRRKNLQWRRQRIQSRAECGASSSRAGNDCDTSRAEVLLVSEARVGCDKNLEAFTFGYVEQLAILERGPAAFVSGGNVVLRQEFTQRNRCALIEKDTHSNWRQRAARSMLEDGANLVKRDAWK